MPQHGGSSCRLEQWNSLGGSWVIIPVLGDGWEVNGWWVLGWTQPLLQLGKLGKAAPGLERLEVGAGAKRAWELGLLSSLGWEQVSEDRGCHLCPLMLMQRLQKAMPLSWEGAGKCLPAVPPS